jgi:hypothetical protein
MPILGVIIFNQDRESTYRTKHLCNVCSQSKRAHRCVDKNICKCARFDVPCENCELSVLEGMMWDSAARSRRAVQDNAGAACSAEI